MGRINDGASFADKVEEWFRKRDRFWRRVSVVTLVLIVASELLFISLARIDPQVRAGMDIVVIPMLLLFVFSIFWRGSIQTFLSLAGIGSIYFGMLFVYAVAAGHETLPPIITNKLGVGNIAIPPPASTLAEFYFLGGMLGVLLCMAISFKPSLFRLKGTQSRSYYPVWTGEYKQKTAYSASVILVPVQGLLSFSERYLAVKYKYLVVMIGGTKYFVSPDDWIPQGSLLIRDKESGALLGIPKVPDGFNIW